MISRTSILLVSCYELGHQPHGLAMPLAFLERAGFAAETLDLSVEAFDRVRVGRARFIGVSVPMHTALRLAVQFAQRAREINPDAHICFYGLYATLNAAHLLGGAADTVLGGEFEGALVELVSHLARGSAAVAGPAAAPRPILERLPFPVPVRAHLPPLDRYAGLEKDTLRLSAGYTEASRGCLHRCLHCPIPPVYDGRFFVVPRQAVLEDVRAQVRSGARHITFGDPDFLNGPRHALEVARALHREHPDVTFDVTTKIEHILKHREMFAELRRLGCVFITSAVESLSDPVLLRLEKGHTRADVGAALDVLDAAGIPMRPSLLPFTPWSTLADFLELLEFVDRRGLMDQVDPVQYSIRLLVPPGSSLLARPDTRSWLGPLDEGAFSYRWRHPDSRMDPLHAAVSRIVERAACAKEDGALTFDRVRAAARVVAAFPPAGVTGVEQVLLEAAERLPAASTRPAPPTRRRPPRLSESWFC